MSAPTIVVTQSEGSDSRLASSLAARGARVFALPTVSIEPPDDFAPLDRALAGIERFDWIVFTSRHAVEAVCERPAWQTAREMALPGLRVAAVGKATAECLSRYGVTADLVPDPAGASNLAALLASIRVRTPRQAEPPLSGIRVLWPCSDIARRELPEALLAAGAELAEPIVYRTVRSSGEHMDEFLRRLESGAIDAIAFMSPSSVRGLAALLGRSDLDCLSGRAAIASIGPTTSGALRELGATPNVESASRTADDLAATLLSYIASREVPR